MRKSVRAALISCAVLAGLHRAMPMAFGNYTTSFDSPAYTSGLGLNGQDGWETDEWYSDYDNYGNTVFYQPAYYNPNGVPANFMIAPAASNIAVSNSSPSTGSQAVNVALVPYAFDGGNGGLQIAGFTMEHSVAPPTSGPTVISFDLKVNNSGASDPYVVDKAIIVTNATGEPMAGIDFDNNTVGFYTPTYGYNNGGLNYPDRPDPQVYHTPYENASNPTLALNAYQTWGIEVVPTNGNVPGSITYLLNNHPVYTSSLWGYDPYPGNAVDNTVSGVSLVVQDEPGTGDPQTSGTVNTGETINLDNLSVSSSLWSGTSGSDSWASPNFIGVVPNAAGTTASFLGAISSPETVTVPGGGITVGSMTFNNAQSYTIAPTNATSVITLAATASSGPCGINVNTGVNTISAPMALTSGVTLTTALSTGLTLAGAISGTGPLITQGTGTVTLSGINSYSGGTTVTAGLLAIMPTSSTTSALPTGALTISGSGKVQLATNVTLGSQTGSSPASNINISALSITGNGTLDINNNHIIINYSGGPDPFSSVSELIKSGYNGGAWNGPGIDSSAAQSDSRYAIGYADGASNTVANLSTGEIEVKYSLYGDINLDGAVNGSDFAILASHFGKSVTGGWQQGDLNYDGAVNGSDFGLLASNFGKSASGSSIALPQSEWAALDTFAAEHGLLTDVPDPTGLSLCGVGTVVLLLYRRRGRYSGMI